MCLPRRLTIKLKDSFETFLSQKKKKKKMPNKQSSKENSISTLEKETSATTCQRKDRKSNEQMILNEKQSNSMKTRPHSSGTKPEDSA